MEQNQEVDLNAQAQMQAAQQERKLVLTKGTQEAKTYLAKLSYEVEILELEARHIEAQYKGMAMKVQMNNFMNELSKGLTAPDQAPAERPAIEKVEN